MKTLSMQSTAGNIIRFLPAAVVEASPPHTLPSLYSYESYVDSEETLAKMHH